MSDPTPSPVPAPAPVSVSAVLLGAIDTLKTFALGVLVCLVLRAPMPIPPPSPTPTPIPPAPAPFVPVPVPTPTPVPPTPVPPVPPAPVPVVTDFFSIGKAYKQALGAGYADAWDANFQVKPGDDLDSKLTAVKSAWDSARSATFGATVAPKLEQLAPNRQAVDQPTADALNKARADFAAGLRTPG